MPCAFPFRCRGRRLAPCFARQPRALPHLCLLHLATHRDRPTKAEWTQPEGISDKVPERHARGDALRAQSRLRRVRFLRRYGCASPRRVD